MCVYLNIKKHLRTPNGQSRMDDSQKKATLDTRHRTETSKATHTTEITKRMSNR